MHLRIATGLLLMLGILAACGGSAAVPERSPAPSLVAAASVTSYRNGIDADMRALNGAYLRPPCGSRPQCLVYLDAVQAATEKLLRDLTDDPAPPSLRPLVEQARAAAQQFEEQLESAIAAVSQTDGDAQAAAGRPDFRALDLAVAELDCWPSKPVNPGDEGDYSCA